MSVTNTPHINFRGDARQALEFYHSVFGGQLMIATYGQFGVPQDDPADRPNSQHQRAAHEWAALPFRSQNRTLRGAGQRRQVTINPVTCRFVVGVAG
jgi:uncharacterized glyoxalase superfamily protein PhnB